MIYTYTHTMMKPYIKGILRCIFMHIHLHMGWYVSYTPHMYYAPICSPEKCFNSTNNESIRSNRYRRTKFLAKMTFHIVHQC